MPLLHFWLCHFPENCLQRKVNPPDLETADSQGPICADHHERGSREDAGQFVAPRRHQTSPWSKRGPVRYPSATWAAFPPEKTITEKVKDNSSWFLRMCCCPYPRAKRLTMSQRKHTNLARKRPKGTCIINSTQEEQPDSVYLSLRQRVGIQR